jgi:dipeptidyl aminopeptidase/acylaminoacyl peptidase
MMGRTLFSIAAGLTAFWLLILPSQAQTPDGGGAAAQAEESLAEARKIFKTKLIRQEKTDGTLEQAPPQIFSTVRYNAPAGKLAAYLTPDPKDGKKHPAIIWITGGDCNSIGENWEPAPRTNDQTAAQYRNAGIVMMFPSLRGGIGNPGVKEGFLGEADDVLAAAAHLRALPYVDPERIYLGGHSTGGTLALLVAASADLGQFRAVFSFGPVANILSYGGEMLPFDESNKREGEMRSPAPWLKTVKMPVFIIEGSESPNIGAFPYLAKGGAGNARVKYLTVKGADHFNLLAPANELIAGKIVRDTGAPGSLDIAEGEIVPAQPD